MIQPNNARTQQEIFERELSARFAFETMLAATLLTATAAMPVSFVLGLAAAVLDGAALSRLVVMAVDALSLGFVIFLGGFVGAVVFGVPVFLVLERLKRRTGAHYVLAGILVNAIAFVILVGRAPLLQNPAEFLYLLPGGVIALLFLRRMAPVWRATETDPAPPESSAVVRLH